MSEHIYLLSIALIPATVLVIFAMRYVSAVFQARARLAHDDAYRQIAQAAAAAETQTAQSLAAIQASLADVAARLGAVEKILKDVE